MTTQLILEVKFEEDPEGICKGLPRFQNEFKDYFYY